MACSYIKNLTIPAGFITNQDADILKGLLAKKDGQYHVFEDLILDVSLSWEDILPRQAKVCLLL